MNLVLVAGASLISEFFWGSTQSYWFISQRSVVMGNIEVGLGLTSQVINISSGHYPAIMMLQRIIAPAGLALFCIEINGALPMCKDKKLDGFT